MPRSRHLRRYRVNRLNEDPTAKLMRDVLFDVLAHGLVHNKTDIAREMADIQFRRRGIVYDLYRAGYGPNQYPTWHLNCPPVGVLTRDRTACCRQRWCPFCWAREVVGPMHKTLTRVWNANPSLTLYLLASGESASIGSLGDIAAALQTSVRSIWSSLDAHSMYSVCSISPASLTGTVRVQQRALILSSEKWLSKRVFAWDGSLFCSSIFHSPTPTAIKIAVRDASAYPMGFMYPQVDTLISLLTQLKGRRMIATYGGFRTKSKR